VGEGIISSLRKLIPIPTGIVPFNFSKEPTSPR
jgi:hypothetical protein